jgi:hypothetical protein
MDTQTEIATLRHFIGGDWVDADGGGVFDVLNPLDDSLYSQGCRRCEICVPCIPGNHPNRARAHVA